MTKIAKTPDTETLKKSSSRCIENGNALLDDAKMMLDWERHSTSLALAVLAQEEFAKAFLLELVAENALPWAPEVRLSLNRHECKHLLSIVMAWVPVFDLFEENSSYLEVQKRAARKSKIMADYDAKKISGAEYLEQMEKEQVKFPTDVADALDIYRHEKIESLGKREPWRDELWAKGNARKLAEGARDRKKQSACFVDIGKDGSVAKHPGLITKKEAEEEISRATALAETRLTWSDEYYLLKEQLKAVFASLQPHSAD